MKKSNRPKRPQSKATDVSELLEQAYRQPGVRQLMDVYQRWRELEDATLPHRRAMGVVRIVSASSTSGPPFRGTY